ncbi:MAG: Ni-sirohydrochlorin a,c-diamide reductive cyclase catalytic subunit [Thermoprotei archaeon]|nr:MAG: Ni-sirohydrochlorin a,c-diamide reductive cyclase catalytic subunit [Thermoprotei archaeon]
MGVKLRLRELKYPVHPRPNPIAAALYMLRDLGCDAVVLHGPSGCNFRALRLLERDGVKVFTTAMSEMDVVMGGERKLVEVLRAVYEDYKPRLIGVVGTCCTSIIGEDVEDEVERANLPVKVIAVNVSACIGDNVDGALRALRAALKVGVISEAEFERQKVVLRRAAEVERVRGVAISGYVEPSEGDDVHEVAKLIIDCLRERRVVAVLNAKKETAYLYSDVILALKQVKEGLSLSGELIVLANLRFDVGLPKVRADAQRILSELRANGVEVDYLTGGLDEYALSREKVSEALKSIGGFDLSIALGIPQALPVELLGRSIGVSSGNRTMSRLRALGYFKVVNEEDAHISVLGRRRIVESRLGKALRAEAHLRSE